MAIIYIRCNIEEEQKHACVICQRKVHRGDAGCLCGVFRKETFKYATLCIQCAAVYDRTMADEELQPVLKFLCNMAHWDGHKPIVDF